MSDSAFTVAWTGPAQRALRKLPEKAAVAAVEFIYGSLADNPQRVGRPLRQELAGLHSARRGATASSTATTATSGVEMVAVEHRADAYRPR